MYEPVWERPDSVGDVVGILCALGGRARVMAGGTDLAVAIKAGLVRPEVLVDLGRVSELSRIAVAGGASRCDRAEIGALATHEAVAAHPVIRERASLLAAACRTVGSPQIRSRGTIGGNLANASPAADAAVALCALGAVARVRSATTGPDGADIPLDRLLVAPRRTALAVGDLVTSVSLDLPSKDAQSLYLKMGQRSALAIAIVSVAVVFEPGPGTVAIALGSVAPTAFRARDAEALFGREWPRATDRAALMEAVAASAAGAASPIDDLRASAWYRTTLVHVLTRRALGALCLGERVN